MNRLVEQLLSVARLDAIALDISKTVDLNEVAARTIGTMAPWALSRGVSLVFSRADKPVPVRGNAHAIEDAIRNLLENGVAHSPSGAEDVREKELLQAFGKEHDEADEEPHQQRPAGRLGAQGARQLMGGPSG